MSFLPTEEVKNFESLLIDRAFYVRDIVDEGTGKSDAEPDVSMFRPRENNNKIRKEQDERAVSSFDSVIQ